MSNNNVLEFNNEIDFEAVVDAMMGQPLTDKQQRSVNRFQNEYEETKLERKVIPFKRMNK